MKAEQQQKFQSEGIYAQILKNVGTLQFFWLTFFPSKFRI